MSLTEEQIATITQTQNTFRGQPKATLSKLQELTTTDPEVKGPSWVSRTVFHAPPSDENDIEDLVTSAVRRLSKKGETAGFLGVKDVAARWTGYRKGAQNDDPEPDISEEAKFEGLMKDVTHPLTVLFFHGGGFYSSGPGRYHNTCLQLAQSTGGRCISFRYRLAPQNPFPAALTDALLVYLSLTNPPPGSFYSPVPPSTIVFAGDSAGACLALQLTLVLLLSKDRSIRFHGTTLTPSLPAGLALISCGAENTLCLPSWRRNATHDIFNPTGWSWRSPNYPRCSIWPSKPPRAHVMCETSMLAHPLVSPSLAEWKGAPPMWFCGGEEMFGDSAKCVAEQAARDGVKVRFEEFQAMPHDFPIMEENWPWAKSGGWWQSRRAMRDWAGTAKLLVEGGELEKGAVFVRLDGEEERMDVENLTGLSREEVFKLVTDAQSEWTPWTGSGDP
ncbi:MAG: hypothetical protein M1820_005273 [Bogoriella megaspora]|nr:MAG: hypothetical protein M1820_005273 [Bogoriella megaspora]